jgi:hypothetical protein
MTDSPLFSESESDDLQIHVEKCTLRYRELRNLIGENMKRLVRLEIWMVGGMAAIVSLLAKLAFWPA